MDAQRERRPKLRMIGCVRGCHEGNCSTGRVQGRDAVRSITPQDNTSLAAGLGRCVVRPGVLPSSVDSCD